MKEFGFIYEGYGSAATFSTFEGRPNAAQPFAEIGVVAVCAASSARRAQAATAARCPEPPAPPPSVHPEVVRLVALQSFDGSFDDSIRAIVGDAIFNEEPDVDRTAWATAVSIAFMSKHLPDPAQKELLDDLLQKAYDFIGGKNDARAKRLIQRAKELV
ncbi:hypothetical protein K438DRAFT_2009815 [Mycena galopus ATCC 62051]|nr:hypothetical protein K438DRAFT_2009815 [Mycena galopus ATCC 62051]